MQLQLPRVALSAGPVPGPKSESYPGPLKPDQLKVLVYLAEGLDNVSIAELLQKDTGWVKNKRIALKKALGVTDVYSLITIWLIYQKNQLLKGPLTVEHTIKDSEILEIVQLKLNGLTYAKIAALRPKGERATSRKIAIRVSNYLQEHGIKSINKLVVEYLKDYVNALPMEKEPSFVFAPLALTESEEDIVGMLVNDYTIQEISEKTRKPESTLRSQLSNALVRNDLDRRYQLVLPYLRFLISVGIKVKKRYTIGDALHELAEPECIVLSYMRKGLSEFHIAELMQIERKHVGKIARRAVNRLGFPDRVSLLSTLVKEVAMGEDGSSVEFEPFEESGF